MSPRRSSGPPRRRITAAAVRLDLLVFVEGLKTEEQYLTEWHRRYRDRVQVTIDPFRGGPLQLVEHAIAVQEDERREARKHRGRPHDQIWCVFDRDEHPNFAAAIALGRRNEINLAMSNPCIEIWFILHVKDQTAYLGRREAQRRSEFLLGCSKVLDSRALSELNRCYDAARARAIRLDEKHDRDGSPAGSNPSSGVWKLIDALKDADDD